ncbi:hypothetical protein PC116_g9506 [Phytophthora cactorum]|uniref:Uncharacterized protein n=1 Tax=Phytophthora cactorum TaxID=29920 RepID=A0A8T1L0F8_9STRA|nr:hypothetical protein Pcac1_g21092 [Phytophthora cactorum]KAG3111911.1 hypothetical protein PI125_g8687 [Phytophthora idaei]KAG2910339.1 hypothetical protein PC114_g9813 [Phytophthora cactorum]KAG2942968.1 hypothetical protein PC117_g9579 [Phytophthora cactorum]KAG3014414.1 hypothetical protein PC120_g12690 [Phytophthora cactorum]
MPTGLSIVGIRHWLAFVTQRRNFPSGLARDTGVEALEK